MTDEKNFDYKDYIQKRLREIDDLDERRYANELLMGSLSGIFELTEEKYKALERRIRNDLDNPLERMGISMTVVKKEDYDPINSFWHPVCDDDIRPPEDSGRVTVYLMADDDACRKFMGQKTIKAVDSKTGKSFKYRITQPERYSSCREKTYNLFSGNHIPWQTMHSGHLERFFDIVPDGDAPSGLQPVFQWGDWEEYVQQDAIPLWNIQRQVLQPQEFRRPCIDEVIYEHIYYLDGVKNEDDGWLVETREDILSIRYEANKIILKAYNENLGSVFVYRLHQGNKGNSYGYSYPVLSNHKADSFASRYIRQAGNFIQTPTELMRKIKEMSGDFPVKVAGYEIMGGGKRKMSQKGMLSGDMDSFISTQVFARDKRSMLVFRFHKEEETPYDYLYESQIRYILSQLQLEFFEYRCMGVME